MKNFLLLMFAIIGISVNYSCFAENYYIADTHFGHNRIIELCNRPFKDVEEMNKQLIKNWNDTVTDDDVVYILGDFALTISSKEEVCTILSELKGKKHLIIGNHDETWLSKMDKSDLEKYFETTPMYMTIIKNDSEKIGLCHYPILSFPGIIIHGHIHNNKNQQDGWDFIKDSPNILNASVEVNNYRPVTLNELIANNKIHKAISSE